jgi:hypothetical protein
MANSWLLFNDELVRPADYHEVFNNNFGGNYKTYKPKSKGEIVQTTNYFDNNAYILVYIKNTERQKILSPITPSDLNINLIKYFEQEKIEERKQKMKKLRRTDNMNIVIFSNDSIIYNHKNKLGIANSFKDYNIDEPFYLNKTQRMLINFPKIATIYQFLKFIYEQTAIPIEMIKLYKFEIYDQNCDLNIRNRSLFKLEEIQKDDYNFCMYDLTNAGKKKLICFYVHIIGSHYQLFSFNKHINKEEYNLENHKLVFISKELNSFSFHTNSKDNSIEETELQSHSLIFLKEIDPETDLFYITDIFMINLKQYSGNIFHHFKEHINQRLKFKLKEDFNILVENTEDSNNFIVDVENYNFFTELNNFFILIPVPTSVESKIYNKLEELYNTIYVDVYCSSKACYIMQKLKIEISKIVDEISLKNLILEEIKRKGFFSKIIDTKSNYLITQNKKIALLDDQYLNQHFNSDNLEFTNLKNTSNKYLSAYKDYPLLKYLNNSDCRIEFEVNLNPIDINCESFCQEVILYDIDNNCVCKISVLFSKKIKKFKEIIDHIYDVFLKNILNQYFYQENFFFLLQNPISGYIYQLVTDSSSDLYKYEARTENMELRIQPYSKEMVEKFQDPNYIKIFICVQEVASYAKKEDKLTIRQPFLIFVEKTMTSLELKLYISEYLQKMKFFKDKSSTPSIIKYYLIKIQGHKINKDVNINQFREEEKLEDIFKDLRVFNILVELHS